MGPETLNSTASRIRNAARWVSEKVTTSSVAKIVAHPINHLGSLLVALINVGLFAGAIVGGNAVTFFGIASILSSASYVWMGNLGGLINTSNIYKKSVDIITDHPELATTDLKSKLFLIFEGVQAFAALAVIGLIPAQIVQLIGQNSTAIMALLTTLMGTTSLSAIGRMIETSSLNKSYAQLVKQLEHAQGKQLQELMTALTSAQSSVSQLKLFLQSINPELALRMEALTANHYQALGLNSNLYFLLQNKKIEIETFVQLNPVGLTNLNLIKRDRLIDVITMLGAEIFTTQAGLDTANWVNNDIEWARMLANEQERQSREFNTIPDEKLLLLSSTKLGIFSGVASSSSSGVEKPQALTATNEADGSVIVSSGLANGVG